LADARTKRAAGIEQRLGAFVDVVSVGIQGVCCGRVVPRFLGRVEALSPAAGWDVVVLGAAQVGEDGEYAAMVAVGRG
jgi:hypothetical protein